MKKLILTGVLLVVVLGGGWWLIGGKDNNDKAMVEKKLMVSIDSRGKLILNLPSKVSMVDLSINGQEDKKLVFKANKQIFNSELINKVDEDGRLRLVLGVMKPTSELPEGETIVGWLENYSGGGYVEGAVTALGDEGPMEINVSSMEVMGE